MHMQRDTLHVPVHHFEAILGVHIVFTWLSHEPRPCSTAVRGDPGREARPPPRDPDRAGRRATGVGRRRRSRPSTTVEVDPEADPDRDARESSGGATWGNKGVGDVGTGPSSRTEQNTQTDMGCESCGSRSSELRREWCTTCVWRGEVTTIRSMILRVLHVTRHPCGPRPHTRVT